MKPHPASYRRMLRSRCPSPPPRPRRRGSHFFGRRAVCGWFLLISPPPPPRSILPAELFPDRAACTRDRFLPPPRVGPPGPPPRPPAVPKQGPPADLPPVDP